jgi:hypothetical protein
MSRKSKNIALLIGTLLVTSLVVLFSQNAGFRSAPSPNAASPGAFGTSIPTSENDSMGSQVPSPMETENQIPIEVIKEQERLANEAMSMAPNAEASAGTDSNIPKFECTALIFSEKSAGKQLVVLQVTAPKSVKTVWAEIQIGTDAYQLEIKINNGFSRSVVGEIRTGEKPPKSVNIYSVPVFNKEMILCED